MKVNKQYLPKADKGIVQVIKSKAITYGTVILAGIVLGILCSYFPFYYILPVAIIPILFLFQINHKYFLLLLLILGFVLFARGFAHLGIEIGGLPLYITEAVLFVTVAILLLDKLIGGDKVNYLKNIPLRKEFAFFYLIGFIALVRGFIYYTPVLTLRHSALFYYSIFYFLMPILFINLRRIELLFKLFFTASIIISVAVLLGINPQLNIYGGLGGFNYLYLSLAVIVESFYFVSLRKELYKILLLLLISLQLWVIFTGMCRGAWIALLVSMLFFLYLSSKMGKLKRKMRKLFFLAILGGIILVTFTASIKPVLFNNIKTEAVSVVFFYRMQNNVSANNVWWRLFIWRDMLRELFKKPLFGWGFGRPFRSPTLEALGWEHGEKEGWIDPHNSHLNIAYKAGIIGYLVFLLIMVRFFRRTMNFLHRCQDDKTKLYVAALLTCVVNVLVIALFLVVLEGPYMGSFLWITMGLIVALENIYKRKETETLEELRG